MTASPLQTDFFPVKWSTRHVFTVTFNRTPFLSMQGQRIVFERHFDRCSSFSKAANANARYKQALKKRIFLEIIDLFGFTILPSWWIVVCPACVLAVRRELSFKNSILSRNFRNSNLEIDVILNCFEATTRVSTFESNAVYSVWYQQEIALILSAWKSGSYAENSFPNLEFNRKGRSELRNKTTSFPGSSQKHSTGKYVISEFFFLSEQFHNYQFSINHVTCN